MDKTEALKVIRTFVKVARDSDDIEAVQKVLREISNVVAMALEEKPDRRAP